MRYIIGPGFTAQDDGGLVRLYHNGTIEARDVGIADEEAVSEEAAPRATPVRMRSSVDRLRAATPVFDSTGVLAVNRSLVSAQTFVIGLIMALVSSGVYFAYLNSPFAQ